MLSCDCGASFEYYYEPPDNLKPFDKPRRKRCRSCKELINIGSDCLEFIRYREPRTDIEEKIHGDTVYLADEYMCEPCGEIFLNLTDIGYCIYLGDDMRENLEDYWELTGFVPVEG